MSSTRASNTVVHFYISSIVHCNIYKTGFFECAIRSLLVVTEFVDIPDNNMTANELHILMVLFTYLIFLRECLILFYFQQLIWVVFIV